MRDSIRRASSLCIAMCGLLVITGCSKDEPNPEKVVQAPPVALNPSPKIGDFAVYAQNSATLRDRVVVSSGDVGVKNVAIGPTLVSGYELAIASDAQVDVAHNVIANRILLQNRAKLGDVQASKLTNDFANYARLFPFPSVPAMPTVASVNPGTTNVTVNLSQVRTISPARYGLVDIKYRGILRLSGGTYHFASVQLADESRVEVLGPVQIRIGGRFSSLARAYLGAASGVTLTAGELRLEISGRNGASGTLTDAPKAADFGNDNTIHSVVLVPNGTLQIGKRAAILGAVAARDVYIDIDSKTDFQSGFGPPPCVPADCNDQNPCTADSCNEGVCKHVPVSAGTSCSDGNACNGLEACNAQGSCAPGTPVVCQASDQCHGVGVCDPSTGVCTNPAKTDGVACNDGNACTQSDSCAAGICKGSNPVVCAAQDQCHDAGSCDSATGICSNPAKADGTACNDGNACTQRDSCLAGNCAGTDPVLCVAMDQCHVAGQCDVGTGLCSTPAAPEGTPCNDGNACTQSDSCAVGVCVGANPVICDAADQCHIAGQCDALTGFCSNPSAPDGTGCSDGNACTQSDSCVAGNCIGANPVICAAQDQCHDVGSCDIATGVCSNPAKADGTACSDGNACTQGDSCIGGGCSLGAPVAIDDYNPCTLDECDAQKGVVHSPAPSGTKCDDLNSCNGSEICDGNGQCNSIPQNLGQLRWVDWTTVVNGTVHGRSDDIDVTYDGEMNAGAITSGDINYWATNASTYASPPDVLNPPDSSDIIRIVGGNNDVKTIRFSHPVINPVMGIVSLGTRSVVAQFDFIDARFRILNNGPGYWGNGPLVSLPGDILQGNEGHGIIQFEGAFESISWTTPYAENWYGFTFAIQAAHAFTCDDGNACNGEEICHEGDCVVLAPPAIEDENPCTIDSCDPATGIVHTPTANGLVCTLVGGSIGVCSDGNCQAHQCEVPPAGMVAWWPGDGHPADIQGSNHAFLRNGTSYAPGMVGQAFTFDGIDDSILVADGEVMHIQNAFTIDAWVNLTERRAYSDGGTGIVQRARVDTVGIGLHLDSSGTKYRCNIDDGPFDFNAHSTTQPTVGVFQHVACSFDGEMLRIYVNGVLEASTAAPVIANIAEPITMGTGHPMKGLLDEVEIFSRALTSAEIGAIYNAGSSGKCKPALTNRPPMVDAGVEQAIDTSSRTEWMKAEPRGSTPSGRYGSLFAYDRVRDRLTVVNGAGLNGRMSEAWVLENASGWNDTPSWTQLASLGAPTPRAATGAFGYDEESNRLVVFGGCQGTCAPALSDVWVLTNANGIGGAATWTQLPNAPIARSYASGAYIQSQKKLVVFGGGVAVSGSETNEVWLLSGADGAGPYGWRKLEPHGTPPAPRQGAAIAYDERTRRLVVHGGMRGADNATNVLFEDTWILTNADGNGPSEWQELTTRGEAPSGRLAGWLQYDATRNTAYLTSGERKLSSTSSTFPEGVWRLVNANGTGGMATWSKLQIGGCDTPPGLYWPAVGFSPARQRLVVATGYGGTTLSQSARNEVWTLMGLDFSDGDHDAPITIGLKGSATDDGLPLGSVLTTLWSQASGPVATISNAGTPETSVTLCGHGERVFNLYASDSQLSANDTTTLSMVRNEPNRAPVVNAGPDRTTLAGATETLFGDVDDDDLPKSGLLESAWTAIDGPGDVAFVNAGSAVTSASFPVAGTYVLVLTANDGELSSSDEVTVVVSERLVEVPNVVGLALSPATSTIETSRLHVGTVTSTIDGAVDMQFDALPSARGWPYEAIREHRPEERIFRVENGMLIQNSMGLGFGASCDNVYIRYGALQPNLLFVIEATVRILAVEEQTGNHYGFSFGGAIPTVACTLGLGQGVIQDGAKRTFDIDTSIFHDYRVECDPASAQYRLFVDGNLIATNSAAGTSGPSQIYVGDGTCGANARAEVKRFHVEQVAVAAQNPDGGALVAPSSAVDLDLRSGPATERVPNVAGLAEADALRVVAMSRLKTRIVRQHSPTVPVGAVIATLPLLGSRALPDDTVTVKVSSGPPKCVPAPADMRAWFRSDGSILDEVSGQLPAQNGTVNYYSAIANQGMAFSDSYLEFAHSPQFEFQGQVTVEGWVRPNAGSGNILSKSDNTGATNAFLNLFYQGSEEYGAMSGRLAFTVYSSDGTRYVQLFTPPGSVRTGEWVHFAASADGSTLRLYLNGVLVTSGAAPPVGSNLGSLVVGAYKRGTSRDGFFGGGVDELAIYGRALSASEISEIYSADSGGKCPTLGNAPPEVNAGSDSAIRLPATAALAGTVNDDGLPLSGSLSVAWSVVSGPGAVSFTLPNSATATAVFTVAGTYVLRLTATDGALTSFDDITVAVTDAPPTNQPPLVSVGPDLSVSMPPGSLSLVPIVSDDGLPTGSSVSCAWSATPAVAFASVNSCSTVATFPTAGTYVLRLTATDGFLSSFDDLTVTVTSVPIPNQSPVVNAGPDRTVTEDAGVLITGSYTDDGLPAGGPITVQWGLLSGPASPRIDDNTQPTLDVLFPEPGTYELILIVNDGLLDGWDTVTVQVTPRVNQAPIANAGSDQSIRLPASATLTGLATDDGLPTNTLTYAWSQESGPGLAAFDDPTSPAPVVHFDQPGTFVLRLDVSDGALSSFDTLTVEVAPAGDNQAPIVNAGTDREIQLPTATVVLAGIATDDGLPVGSTLAVQWTQVSGPAPVTFANPNSAATTAQFITAGRYSLSLTATDGTLTTSDIVEVMVWAPPGGPTPNVAITTPADSAVVTTLAAVTGTAADSNLYDWALDYRSVDDSNWTRFATGTNSITNGRLADFDPTLLLNGLYEIRLTATDLARQVASTSVIVSVEGNQKIGNFTASFKDLSVPVAGIPIEVIRTYDSRDKRRGDFGIGWTLDIKSLRLQKNRVLGQTWETTVEAGGPLGMLQVFCLVPSRRHYVTVTFADGKVFRWEAHVVAPGSGYNGRRECQLGADFSEATVAFTPLAPTTATLSRVGGTNVLVYASWPGNDAELVSAEDGSSLFDPDRFVITLQDGRQLDVAQATGLERVTDTNGNTLEVRPTGLVHSSGKSVTFARDTQGRITQITDPLGNHLEYAYDGQGDLVSFRDQVNNLSHYGYDSQHYLLSIEDPRGIVPIRNEYDASGRLISHTDANGETITYDHQIVARREVVTDRLGNATTHAYDDRGNVLSTTNALGEVTSYTYDDRDNKLSECNALSQCSHFTYDDSDNKLTETDPLGNVTRYTYDSRGNVLTTTDPMGRVTSNAYDSHGNLTSTMDAMSNATTYVYETRGLQTQVTDALGHVTSSSYDVSGNLTSETAPNGRTTTYTYDANGNRLSQTTTRTTSSGVETLITQYAYDEAGRLIRTTHPDGSVTSSEYNSIGQQSVTIDPLGHRIERTYDAQGRLVTTTYPDGTTETTTYDAEGRRLSSKDRADRETSYAYDALGRLIRTTMPDGTFTTTTYDAAGRTVATTDEVAAITQYEYDDAGRRLRVIDPLNQVTSFSYDAAGNQRTMTDPLGQVTTYVYDALNRRTQVVFADGTTETTQYDALGHRSAKIDQASRTTAYGYDAEGRLIQVTDALGGMTHYEYDELGNQLSQIDALGRVTRFAYDNMGRRTRRTLPPIAPATAGASETMEYDLGGNLIRKTDFMGRATNLTYDINNRVESKQYPDSSSISFAYFASGRRASVTDSRGTTTYVYDVRDRLVQHNYPDGRRLSYSYDARGQRTRLTAGVAGQTITTGYGYDAMGRLSSVTDPLGGTYGYSYLANGSRQSLTQPNGTVTSYSYDPLGRLTSLESRHQPSNRIIQSYVYSLGPTGIRTQIAEAGGVTRAYGYDALYRLTAETITGSSSDYSKAFTYDAVGNRLAQATTGYNAANVAYSYDDRDRLLTENATGYGWDLNGNLTSKSGDATYTWDYDDRLIRVTKADGTMVEHSYDADGVRVRTVVTPPGGGAAEITNYLVDPSGALSHVVATTDGTGALTAYYVRGGDQLLAVLRGTDARYYNQDGLGSVRALVGLDGTTTDSYAYTAFGEALGWTGADEQPYRFAGEASSGDIYYLRNRWTDPTNGRFLSSDPHGGNLGAPQSLHSYGYVHNNPIQVTDPLGLFVALPELSSSLIDTLFNSLVSTRPTNPFRRSAWRHDKSSWSTADEDGLRDYVVNNSHELVDRYNSEVNPGNPTPRVGLDCADFVLRMLVKYAVSRALPVVLQGFPGGKTLDSRDFRGGLQLFLRGNGGTLDFPAASLIASNIFRKGGTNEGSLGALGKPGDILYGAHHLGYLISWNAPRITMVDGSNKRLTGGYDAVVWHDARLLTALWRPEANPPDPTTIRGVVPEFGWWKPHVFAR